MKKPCSNKNKGVWSKEEDQKLIKYMQTHGEGCWRCLPQAAGLLRSSKSCRLRWINYLRPDLKRGKFAEDEEDLIIKLHALLGNRWSLIAGRLPGRTDNEVKSYWNSDHLRRKMIRMGIGPNNNYGLSRNIPSCPQNQWVLAGNTSSGSKNQTCQPCQPANSCAVNDQVSNAGSFVENNGTCILPDLNLDLIMAIPSESFTHIEEKQQHEESKLAVELNMEPCPTLLLFK